MNKLYYKTSIAGLLIVIIAIIGGCSDDFVTTNPKGSLDQKTLANEQGANGALMSAYSLLNDNGASGGGIYSSRTVVSGMPSDEVFPGTTGGAGTMTQIHFFRLDEGLNLLDDRWTFLYAGVQRSNDVLRLLDREDMEISEEAAQRIRAEARFLRGHYHLDLQMLFGNVPYVDETVTFSEGNYRVSNEASAWPDIEADFQYASENLEDTGPNPGNANRWAAKSMLAKTYMHQAKFTEAQPLLEDVIANGVTSSGESYDLHDEYHWNFNAEHKNGPEAIFSVQMSVDETASTGNMIERGNGPYGGSSTAYGWMQPTFDFVDRFQTEDGLPLVETYHETPIKTDHGLQSTEEFTPEEGPLDPRLDWSVGRRGIPYLDHGINPGRAWIRTWDVGGPYSSIKSSVWVEGGGAKQGIVTNAPYNIIRFADILLRAAEVEVEIGSLAKAEAYVNRVRERAANPDGFLKMYEDPHEPTAGFSDEPAANYEISLYDGEFTQNGQDWAREAVRFERVLELGTEHHRFHDLQRYDKVDGGGYMADVLNDFLQRTLERPFLDQGYFGSDDEFTQGKNEVYPIPLEQIDLSVDPETGEPTLQQNPGY